jgi:hypothetical protein
MAFTAKGAKTLAIESFVETKRVIKVMDWIEYKAKKGLFQGEYPVDDILLTQAELDYIKALGFSIKETYNSNDVRCYEIWWL